jgi:hypothetical protein
MAGIPVVMSDTGGVITSADVMLAGAIAALTTLP